VLIVGAGGAGCELLDELRKEIYAQFKYDFVGFVDDDAAKVGKEVLTLPVIGTIDDLPELIRSERVATLFIAIPSTDGKTIRRIISRCQGCPVRIKIVPRLSEVINGTVNLDQVRDIQVEDVLGRAVVRQDFSDASDRARDKVMMVFGAAGSIGSELCTQLVGLAPKRVVCVDFWENGIFDLQHKLEHIRDDLETPTKPDLSFHIANIRDAARMNVLAERFKPDVVFNAAAYKHVPLMEDNPLEAVENNIGGTQNLFEAAIAHGVESFILISSDKAVNPTGVMGATKRATEMMMHVYSKRASGTRFSAVRFGNVLNSSGSVIPTFKHQIREGVVTVTHPEVYRYFMTVQEATQLVLQCWLLGRGDQVFVLEMGDPVRIADLAELMIRLSGHEPGRDVKIEYVGLRPGEKLYEEPLTEVEETTATKNERVFIVTHDMEFDHERFMASVGDLLSACARHEPPDEIRERLKAVVPTYRGGIHE